MGEFAGWTCAAIWGLRCRRVLLSRTKTDRINRPRVLEKQLSCLQSEFDIHSSQFQQRLISREMCMYVSRQECCCDWRAAYAVMMGTGAFDADFDLQ